MAEGIYPGANRTERYWPNGGGVMQSIITKLVLHSTETRTLPGYSNGGTAPTLTVDVRNKRVWQHFRDVRVSAKALRDTGGFAENRDSVAQIEIMGYSDRKVGNSVGGLILADMTDDQIEFLAEVVAWFCVGGKGGHSVPVRIPSRMWPQDDRWYGTKNGYRMSQNEYDSYNGILAHAHVPQSVHWDVVLDIAKLIEAVKRKLESTPPPVEPPVVEPGTFTFPKVRVGDRGMNVKRLQGLLIAHGYDLGAGGADGIWGTKTSAAVKDFNKKNSISSNDWLDISWRKALGV